MCARYDSDDSHPELLREAYGHFRPLLLSQDSEDNPLALGSIEVWEGLSLRDTKLAFQIGSHLRFIAQHCSDFARSSGGWVSFAEIVAKLHADGYTNHTVALAAHGVAALAPGSVEVLGLPASKRDLLTPGSDFAKAWEAFLDPPAMDTGPTSAADRATRARLPIPVFYRACQGHSCFVPAIERMLAPYEPGLSRCHGPLVHVTNHEALMESMMGDGYLCIPGKAAGLCHESDYDLLHLIPTKRDPAMEQADHVPAWLSQRRDGVAPPPRSLSKPASAPTVKELPCTGLWPDRCTPLLWDMPPNHRTE